MSWPKFSLQYRYTIFSLLIAIIVFGIASRLSLPVQLFPDTDPPVVTIVTPYPGVAATDVAKNLSKLIEEEAGGIDGIRLVTSTSQTGLSMVKAEFHYTKSIESATLDVQNALGRIRQKLPANILEPQVLSFSSSDKPIMTVAVNSGSLPLSAVRELADNALKDRLQLIDGVAAVDVFGGHKNQLEVILDRQRLEAYRISIDQVKRALREWNISASGGRVHRGDRESVVRFDLSIRDAEQANRIVVARIDKRNIYLGDVAQVEISEKEERSAYRFNGEAAIALQIMKRDEANAVEVAERLQESLERIRAGFPQLQLEIADDDSIFTNLVISNMTHTIMVAVILTIIVVMLFLAHLRQAAIIAISIPVAFLMTFILMRLAGIDLNMVTMSAIILSIGLLVDDGIVVLENIHRHIMDGKTPFRAAIDGTEEIFLADLAGTVTTISVLVPLMFLGGFVGKLFGPLALTLTFALASSFVVSVTLIPLLTALWLRHETEERRPVWFLEAFQRLLESLRQLYLGWLERALRYPWRTVFIGIVLLVGGLRLISLLGSEMLPKFDAGTIQVTLDTIPGTPLEETLAVAGKLEKRFLADSSVVSVSTTVGYEAGGHYLGSRGAMDVNQAEMIVTLLPRNERDESIWSIMDRIRAEAEAYPGVTLLALREKGGTARSTTAAPIDVRLTGDDPVELDRLGGEVADLLRGISGTRNIYRSWAIDSPEIRVVVDRQRAGEFGLSGEAIAAATYEAVEGIAVTPFRQPADRDLDITLRYVESDRRTVEELGRVHVPGPDGNIYPLSEIAELEGALAPRIVTRENFQRTLDVLGYNYGRPLSGVVTDIRAGFESIAIPDGYSISITGEQRDFQEARQRMMRALAMGILAVYLVLVAQFRSFRHPLTIMMAIPLQFIGVGLALLLAGKYLSMPALLGVILLTGTVVNNSIVLIDYILARLRDGAELKEALLESVSVRYRPIMMTAFSDIAGMLPLALEMSVGAERFSPIATVVIGGILAATLLTMVFIPVLFSLFYRRTDIEKERVYDKQIV